MGLLFQNKNCPICGKPMTMALPPGGVGPKALRCLECDPLRDEKSLAWVKSELQPPKPSR